MYSTILVKSSLKCFNPTIFIYTSMNINHQWDVLLIPIFPEVFIDV